MSRSFADPTVCCKSVILVETDPEVRQEIPPLLEELGYEVHLARDYAECLQVVAAVNPGTIVLDISIRRSDGLMFLRTLRQSTEAIIIAVSRSPDETEEIVALEAAADDYIARPFSNRLLLARIRAKCRRFLQPSYVQKSDFIARVDAPQSRHLQLTMSTVAGGRKVYSFAGIYFDDTGRNFWTEENGYLHFSDMERELLHLMIENANNYVPMQSIYARLYPASYTTNLANVRTLVARVRRKLQAHANRGDLILTARLKGYILLADIREVS